MELFTIIMVCLVFVETSFLMFKSLKKSNPGGSGRRKVYIDTSVLIDGRIVEVAKTHFLGDNFFIPRSVLRELQLLADGKDTDKRARARYGLDIARDLERLTEVEVMILEDELDRTPVDERLIQLAKNNKGLILTNDFNLNKVATTEGIEVLNLNDLSLALRVDYLPGDTFTLTINGAGSNPKQGVGHLPDGTMVVVDNAISKIGKEVKVEFVRFLQTSAGRMMFAKLSGAERKSRKRNC